MTSEFVFVRFIRPSECRTNETQVTLTLDDQPGPVRGCSCHAGRRALEPRRVFRLGGSDVQRRPSAFRLYVVSTTVVSVRQHPAVSLPAHHRHRDTDSLCGELYRLTLDHSLIDHSIDEPRRLSCCSGCTQEFISCLLFSARKRQSTACFISSAYDGSIMR